MTDEQRIVRYSGNVQGVGFRFTAVRAAQGFDVTGCVRNLPGGRVECLVEGDAKEIDAFLSELAERMAGHIRDRQQQTAPRSGRYHSFTVAF